MSREELADYVISLHLTETQRAFAEAYVLAPGNATAAALVASPALNRANAGSSAARWLKTPKVQEYIAAIRGAPSFRVDIEQGKKVARTKVGRRIARTAVALERSLEILSEQAESREPWEVSVTEALDKDGEMRVATRRKLFAPGIAASKILDHYAPRSDAQGGNRTLVINLLQKMPPEQLEEAVLGLLSGSQPQAG
jgi:phage terminase small subunit